MLFRMSNHDSLRERVCAANKAISETGLAIMTWGNASEADPDSGVFAIKPKPDLKTAATAWILAGGSHHTVYSQQLDTRYLEIFAEMAGTEMLVIDAATRLHL